jgi:DNA-binding NarL/FixJ family response regulator
MGSTPHALAYLVKQSSAPILIDAIREVLKGKAYFSSSIPKCLRDECQKIFAKIANALYWNALLRRSSIERCFQSSRWKWQTG